MGREHKVLIASQPTRGLDVGSIEFVHRRIIEQRDHGVAVVIVSSELDEIYALADRIAVMYEGKITGFRDPDVPAAELGRLMAGGADSTGVPGAVVGADGVHAVVDDGSRPRRHDEPGAPTGPPRTRRASRPGTRPPRRRKRDHPTARAPAPEPEPSATPPPAGEPEPPAAGDRSFGEHLRDAIQDSTVTVTVLALVAAIVLGGLLTAFTNTTVLHAWSDFFSAPGNAIAKAWDAAAGTYVALFEGSVFNPHTVAALFQQASISTAIHDGYLSAVFDPLSETAVQATPLILAGLAVALPYQAGMFNIGGQSQFIGGAIMAAWLGYAVNLPFFVHVVVCVLGGFVGGAALGWLAGEIKARTGAHEVIVTIMLNYVMQYFLAYLLSSQSLMQAPGGSNSITQAIASNAHLPLLAGTHLRINAGFLIALACAFGGVVAAQPDHDRVRVPQRRRQRAARRASPG